MKVRLEKEMFSKKIGQVEHNNSYPEAKDLAKPEWERGSGRGTSGAEAQNSQRVLAFKTPRNTRKLPRTYLSTDASIN